MIAELALLWACFLVFGVLAKLHPCTPGQPRFISRETPTDLIYLGTQMLGSGVVASGAAAAALALIYGPDAEAVREAIQGGRGALAGLPLWSQILLILVISDVIQYWLHRGFHASAVLWPFHAIHHSSRMVDWITTYRGHPVNFVLYSTSVSVLLLLLGFSPVAFAVLAPLNLLHACLVHANLDWDFGPFRYVLASPVFHRWHHVDDPDVWNKNFAPTFPILDVIFGTFYMPKGLRPQVFGAADTPSEGYFAQLVHPFKVLAARRGADGAASQPGA